MKEASRISGFVLDLLASKVLGYEGTHILSHVWPTKIILYSSKCFRNAPMSAQKGGVEFCRKSGDEIMAEGKPQLAVVENEAPLN